MAPCFKKIFPHSMVVVLVAGCSAMYKDQQRVDRIHHESISYTQSMIRVELAPMYRNKKNIYPGSGYGLYLGDELLMTANENREFLLSDKKLRWRLYEIYKDKGKLCFEIRRGKPKYDLSMYSEYNCFINTELEKKFSVDMAIEELEQKIRRLEAEIKSEAVLRNSNFNSRTQTCDKPYIKPISNLCGRPQKELDRLYIDCFRPLGSKACRYLAEENIERKNLSAEEKRRKKLASAIFCKTVVGGKITGAEIADELGDELTSSDNIFVQGAGYLLEFGSAIATTASVSSCLSRFDMHCDTLVNQRKLQNYQQCSTGLVMFDKKKDELKTLEKQVNSLRYSRSRIVRNRSPKKSSRLILAFNNRF
ncbi:hypothetical protein [Pseudoalteromonas rubra]|uniref:Lipoprotein n=1 Tax=Pseudoalteromonas rubra TaxID=43658 RepID=A0A0F4QIG4_9GAMM|nr:hypothetical protein [Pseudoalteromonas rubra]KJZ07065.1 hypothetical protein TW77_16390 [Pseudoalteromonas rubra]